MEFKLIVADQNRVLLSLAFFSTTFVITLVWASTIANALAKTAVLVLIPIAVFYVLYQYCVGTLTVRLTGTRLEFFWKHKLFFKYASIGSIEVAEIRTLVIDPPANLRQIITVDRKVVLNVTKLKDGLAFVDFLVRETNARKMDSWDVWKERGWIGIAYWINVLLLTSISCLAVYSIIVRGFSSHILIYVLAGLVQQLIHHQIIKGKLEKSK